MSEAQHLLRRNQTAETTNNLPELPSAQSARTTSRNRYNKIYRGPPTPPPDVLYNRERCFILDCKAVANISNDYSTANPKLGSVIPPYVAQLDSGADSYFDFFGVKNTLKKTGQLKNPESNAGQVYDRFHTRGYGFRYLSHRNKFGSGHSTEQVRGHELFLNDPKPVVNYNGLFGYRRNTPSLRQQATIGLKKLNANGYIPNGRYSVIGCGKSYSLHCQCKLDQACRCHNQDKLCPCIKA